MKKSLAILTFSICLATGFYASSWAQNSAAMPEIQKLKHFVGTWESNKGTPAGPDTQFRNVYEWAFDKTAIRVKTFVIGGAFKEPKFMYETMFVWSREKKRLASIGFGRNTFEENVIEVAENGEVKVGFSPYFKDQVVKMRFLVKMAKDKKSVDHVAFMKRGEKFVELYKTHWTKKS